MTITQPHGATAVRPFRPDALVALGSETLRGDVSGAIVGRAQRLGPGIVTGTREDGTVRVHWIEPDFDAWMEPADLRALAPGAPLVSIFRCEADGTRHPQRHERVAGRGLQHHWTIEFKPNDVVRAERSDGLAWTFDWHPIMRRLERHGTVGMAPTEDDEAEALTAAEAAVGVSGWEPEYGPQIG